MNATECLAYMHWRYACKKFDPSRKIDAPTWSAIAQIIRLSPSSLGLQPWKFIQVDNPEIRQQLRAVSWNQSQVTDASHLLVFCGRREVTPDDVMAYIKLMAEVREVPSESLEGYRKKMEGLIFSKSESDRKAWIERQVYIALGVAMQTAAQLQIDTCAIEGMEPERYDEILNLKDTPFKVLCALALGYRSSDDAYAQQKKVRFAAPYVWETI